FFWGTWSAPCKKIIPELNALQKRFGENLAVLGLAAELQPDVESMTDPKVEFFSGIDARGRLRTALGITTIPYVLLIDAKGIVRYQGHPAAITAAKLQSLFSKTSQSQ